MVIENPPYDVDDRPSFVAVDFFEAIPAIADTIILKSVIHDWNDERSSLILRKCRQALPKGGTLSLVERIIRKSPSTRDEDKSTTMSDLNMLEAPAALNAPKMSTASAERKWAQSDIDLSG